MARVGAGRARKIIKTVGTGVSTVIFVCEPMNYWLAGWSIDWVWAVCGRAASRKLSSDRQKNNKPNAIRMKMAPPAIIQTALRLLKSHFMCDGSDGSTRMVVSTFIGGTLPPVS